jgi:hypothetical protein
MARSLGFTLPLYTTVQLVALVAQYGPTGTVEVNGLQLGNLVFDTTTLSVKMYDGTNFVAIA